MPKPKKVSKKVFNSLTYDKQVKEVKKMAKRANVRIALLEEEKQVNSAYEQSQSYNESLGRNKNRFYEGLKYKTQSALKDAFNALSKFLNNKGSTLTGIEDNVREKIDTLMKDGNLSFNELKKMSSKERIYASQYMATLSNRRLKELEKNGIDYYAYATAEQYNEATGRKNNRFYRGAKFNNDGDLNIHLENEIHFLNSETSTAEGVQKVHDHRINAFRKKGVDIPVGKEKDFNDFLSSEQFTALKKYADSNQVLETFVDARKAGVDAEIIMREFEEYMNTDMTFDEVQERLHVAKWQQGGLLH